MTARNQFMADTIFGHIISSDERAFIACGADHLIGRNGVLRLLEDKGIQVSLLKNSSFVPLREVYSYKLQHMAFDKIKSDIIYGPQESLIFSHHHKESSFDFVAKNDPLQYGRAMRLLGLTGESRNKDNVKFREVNNGSALRF